MENLDAGLPETFRAQSPWAEPGNLNVRPLPWVMFTHAEVWEYYEDARMDIIIRIMLCFSHKPGMTEKGTSFPRPVT